MKDVEPTQISGCAAGLGDLLHLMHVKEALQQSVFVGGDKARGAGAAAVVGVEDLRSDDEVELFEVFDVDHHGTAAALVAVGVAVHGTVDAFVDAGSMLSFVAAASLYALGGLKLRLHVELWDVGSACDKYNK